MERVSEEATSECARRILGACHEAHQRPESARCGRPNKVQSRHRRFESGRELWVAIDPAQRSQQIWCKEGTARNIDPVTSGQQSVVDTAFGPIIESDPDLLADEVRRDDHPAGRDSYLIHPGPKPSRASRPDRPPCNAGVNYER